MDRPGSNKITCSFTCACNTAKFTEHRFRRFSNDISPGHACGHRAAIEYLEKIDACCLAAITVRHNDIPQTNSRRGGNAQIAGDSIHILKHDIRCRYIRLARSLEPYAKRSATSEFRAVNLDIFKVIIRRAMRGEYPGDGMRRNRFVGYISPVNAVSACIRPVYKTLEILFFALNRDQQVERPGFGEIGIKYVNRVS